jgi:hypothetical protein
MKALVYLTEPVVLENLKKNSYLHLTNPSGHQVPSLNREFALLITALIL